MPVISNFELDAFQSLSDEMKSLARKMDDLLADMRKPADDEADCPYSPKDRCCLTCDEFHIACMIRDALDGYIDLMYRTGEPIEEGRVGRFTGPIEYDNDYLRMVAQILPNSWSCSLWHKLSKQHSEQDEPVQGGKE